MPRPTRRGWRTHQKVSTSATKSGARRRSLHGRKLRNSAIAREAAIVLARAGRRMSSLPSAIVVLALGAPRRLFRAPVLLGLLRKRRARRRVRQHQHVAAALDA